MKIVYQNLLLQIGGNTEGDSKNEGSQQGVNRPPDCILAVSDDGAQKTEVESTDAEPKDEGNAIHVQCVQTKYRLNYWIKTIWGWINLYIGTNNVDFSHRGLPMGVLWSILYPR